MSIDQLLNERPHIHLDLLRLTLRQIDQIGEELATLLFGIVVTWTRLLACGLLYDDRVGGALTAGRTRQRWHLSYGHHRRRLCENLLAVILSR